MLQRCAFNYLLWKTLRKSLLSFFGFDFYKCCDKLLYFKNFNYHKNRRFFTLQDVDLKKLRQRGEIELYTKKYYDFQSIRFCSSSSYSRRIDIFTKTDETLRKLNEFLLVINSQTEYECFKSSLKLHLSCKNPHEEELLLEAYDCWNNGHIIKAYGMFSKLYEKINNFESQQRILTTVQCLIFNTLTKKSKVFNKNVLEGAKKFSKEHNEICILVAVWHALFVSEWYENQCLAEDVLQNSLELRDCLDKVVPLLGYYFLKRGQLNNYQRLIETALRYDKKSITGILLRALFNYYYKIGYTKGCDVVLKCCDDLDIKLTENQVLNYNAMKIPRIKAKKKEFQITTPKDVKYKF